MSFSFLEYNVDVSKIKKIHNSIELKIRESEFFVDTKPFIDDFLKFMNPFLNLQKNKMYTHRSIIEILNTFGGIYIEDEYNIDKLAVKSGLDIVDFTNFNFDEDLLQVRKFRRQKDVNIEDFVKDLKCRFLYGFYDLIGTGYAARNSWTLLYPKKLFVTRPMLDDPTFLSFGGFLDILPLGDIILQKRGSTNLKPETDIFILNDDSIVLVKMHIVITRNEKTARDMESDFFSYKNLFFITFRFECPESPKEIIYYNHFQGVDDSNDSNSIDSQQRVLKCLYTNNLQCFNKFCLYRFYEQHDFNGLPFSYMSYMAFMNFTKKEKEEEIMFSISKWLNGDLINYCLNDWNMDVESIGLCSSEVNVKYQRNVEFINKCKENDKDIVLIPFNPGSHWILLAFSRKTETVYVYDSLHDEHVSDEVKEITKSIFFKGKELKYQNVSIPRQPGFVECGYSTLYYAFKILTVGEEYFQKEYFFEDIEGDSIYLSKKVFWFIRKKMVETMLKALLGERENLIIEIGSKRSREDVDIRERDEEIVIIHNGDDGDGWGGATERKEPEKEEVEEIIIIDNDFAFL